jgi:hypothetical protein
MNTNNNLVIFSVTDSFGCTADITYNVDTPVLGEANFKTSSYGNDVYGLYSIYDPILFDNLATGDFIKVAWDFGDGSIFLMRNQNTFSKKQVPIQVKQTVTFGLLNMFTAPLYW